MCKRAKTKWTLFIKLHIDACASAPERSGCCLLNYILTHVQARQNEVDAVYSKFTMARKGLQACVNSETLMRFVIIFHDATHKYFTCVIKHMLV